VLQATSARPEEGTHKGSAPTGYGAEDNWTSRVTARATTAFVGALLQSAFPHPLHFIATA